MRFLRSPSRSFPRSPRSSSGLAAALAATLVAGCASDADDGDLATDLAAPSGDDLVATVGSGRGSDLAIAADRTVAAPTLTARAVLPALTFAPGPTSGHLLGTAAVNGITPPFPGQPVQGFSALVPDGDGGLLAMPDNGYGAMENSADFRLRVYRIAPAWKTAGGGAGTVEIRGFIELSDPGHRVPFALANDFLPGRPLTGADFDIESLRVAADGTLWFGDELGPFLLHTDGRGRVLEAPIAVPDLDGGAGAVLRSPQNPGLEEASAVRVMNAMASHGRRLGATRAPVFSPWDLLLVDGDPATGLPDRAAPPAGSGLAPASSEIFDVTSLHSAGYPVVPWTVDAPPRMDQLLRLGVDGMISDRPDLLYRAVAAYDADRDGHGGDYLDADGLIDPARFDAQGHRGGRDLRPENTLPAFEVALDSLMNTLELDVGLTRDLVPVVDHDPQLMGQKCRRADGEAYPPAGAPEALIHDLTWRQLRATFVCDRTFRGPQQQNDPALSPVAVAFQRSRPDLPHIYTPPTLDQLFAFVDFYARYYATGAGRSAPDAARRARNAARVRFNIETKLNPRREYAHQTAAPALFALVVSAEILGHDLVDRADLQSFDFESLSWAHWWAPAIRSVYLFGDFPVYADPSVPGSDDGTNLQPQGARTPWLGGLAWPYRQTRLDHPVRVNRSGGLEGMAMSADGTRLYPLLEQSIAGDPAGELRMFEYDLVTRQWSLRARYQLDAGAVSIGDFTLVDDRHGVVIERDNGQGRLDLLKRVYEITLGAPGARVTKRLAVDLERLADPGGITAPVDGDLGLGRTFSFPFQTIESVVVADRRHLVIANDNNFPFSVGRHVGTGLPDDTELIVIELDRPLGR